MFKIVPTPETEKFLAFLKTEAPKRVKQLEYVVAARVGAYALEAIKDGLADDHAYIKAYKDSLRLVQIAVTEFGAAGIVGSVPVDWTSADVRTMLVVFQPGARSTTDPGSAVLSDPRFQPWAIDALPPISVSQPIMLRFRDATAVQARRAANLSYRAAIDAELNRQGVKFGATFSPDGGAFLDTQDLAAQLEFGGPGFPSASHWRGVVASLKKTGYVRDKVFKDYLDAIEGALTDPENTKLSDIAPSVQGSVSTAQMVALNKRPGGLTGFAEIMGGYQLF